MPKTNVMPETDADASVVNPAEEAATSGLVSIAATLRLIHRNALAWPAGTGLVRGAESELPAGRGLPSLAPLRSPSSASSARSARPGLDLVGPMHG